jgi:hypothetical protein
MSMFIKERNSLGMYTFHLTLCRRCTRAQLIPVSRALCLTEFLLVSVCTVAASQQKRQDWLMSGASHIATCVYFVPYLLPRICQEYVPLLLALEILLQIKPANASGLRTHSQTAITTSKLPFVALIPSVPPPFGFTELKLCYVQLGFMRLTLCSEWTPHYIKYISLRFQS